MSLLGFGIGTMLTNLHRCCFMFVLRAVFNMVVRNASQRGPMCFRCLIYSLSGPCELFFYFVLDLSCGECDVIFLYFMCCTVDGSFVLCVACLTMFVNCLMKQFAICLGVVVILV